MKRVRYWRYRSDEENKKSGKGRKVNKKETAEIEVSGSESKGKNKKKLKKVWKQKLKKWKLGNKKWWKK